MNFIPILRHIAGFLFIFCGVTFVFPTSTVSANNEEELPGAGTSSFSTDNLTAEDGRYKKWHPRIELEGKLGTKRSTGEPRLFFPITEGERSLIFSDIRGTFDDFGSIEGNIGLGYRRIVDSSWILGGSLFFDLRRTRNENTFIQGMIGLEALSTVWDFRTNFYIPESTQKGIAGSGSAQVTQAGTSLRINSQGLTQERALPGFDAEIGRHFPLKSNAEIAMYVGGFHFNADGFENISGPRVKLELSFWDLSYLGNGSKFTLGGEYQSDSVRGGQGFLVARLNIPLENLWGYVFTKKKNDFPKRTLSPLERRMTNSVVRDVDIMSGEVKASVINEAAQFNGTTVSQIVTVDANTPGGAVAAVTAAGENTLVVLDGGAGTINIASTLTPRVGQTLAGGGASLSFTGATSGQTASFTLAGTPGTLNQTNAVANGINATLNTNFTNFTITGGVASILIPANVSDVRISNMNITGGRRGIFADRSGDISISNSTITSGDLEAIRLTTVNNTSLSNNVINATGTDGVFVSGVNNIYFSNNIINFSGSDDGMDINGFVNTFSGSGNTILGNVPGLHCEITSAVLINFTLTFENATCR